MSDVHLPIFPQPNKQMARKKVCQTVPKVGRVKKVNPRAIPEHSTITAAKSFALDSDAQHESTDSNIPLSPPCM